MYRRRIAFCLAVIALLLVVGFAAQPYANLDTAIRYETWLRQQVVSHPVFAFLVAFAVYVVLTLIPGLTGKSILFGWLLGFLPGLIVVNAGLTLAAVIMFAVSRRLLRDAVRHRFRWFVERLNRELQRDEAGYLVFLRLIHAPYTITNYALGATNVPVRRFWWTTQLGLLPGNVAFVLAGAGLPSLSELHQRGAWSFVDVKLLVGLTAMGLLPIAVNRLAVFRAPPRPLTPPAADEDLTPARSDEK